jgi:hypothetical protein
MKESKFQKQLVDEIKTRFPGSIVLKNDATYLNCVPDLLILYEDHWATLEVKNHSKAHHQPLQDYYVKLMNKMSFSSFIYPENREEVLNELQRSFKSSRRTRVSRRK